LQSLHCLASDPWEWSGVYDFPAATHLVWSAARNAQGSYAEPNMKLVVVQASAASSAGLHAAESAATSIWNGGSEVNVTSSVHIEAGPAVTAGYRLHFDTRTWVTHFEFHVNAPGAYAVFTEHMPHEFENGFHFFRTETGVDVEAVAEEGGSGHGGGHGSTATAPAVPCPWTEAWEWTGVFSLPASGWYTWNAARQASGSYADATMKLVIVAAANNTAEGLAASEPAAHALYAGTAIAANSGTVLQMGTAYTLTFDDHSWTSHFFLQASAAGAVAFYAQHLPIEFEKEFHYLKDASGTDIEPGAQMSVADCSSTAGTTTPTGTGGSWGEVLGGSFITCLPTLLGMFFILRAKSDQLKSVLEKAMSVVSSFASGVIFAAAVFLLLPEALHLAGSGHEEVVGTWTWGTAILAGWFSCYLITGISTVIGEKFGERAAKQQVADPENVPAPTILSTFSVVGPVLLGDFFHNFSDGLVIGVAFKVCGGSFGWELVGVTVAHEIPQEIADLMILILDAKVEWHWATLANFLCSLSTVIGAIITFSADVGSNQEGIILAYGAGVYIFVAITELAGHILHPKSSNGPLMVQFAQQFLAFIVGAVLIGLVLLNHKHCAAPVAPGSPAPVGGHHH